MNSGTVQKWGARQAEPVPTALIQDCWRFDGTGQDKEDFASV
jgi:hypothetical protein